LVRPRDKCGVIGVYSPFPNKISRTILETGFYLQLRGHDSGGMAVLDLDNGRVRYHKDTGLFSDIFQPYILDQLVGNLGIGHIRYGTEGERGGVDNAGPVEVERPLRLFVAHNGNLPDYDRLRDKISQRRELNTSTDTELLAILLSEAFYKKGIKEGAREVMERLDGSSYSITGLIPEEKIIFGLRDPRGFKPLSVGRLSDGTLLIASEDCAIQGLDGRVEHYIEPGGLCTIDANGDMYYERLVVRPAELCNFEYVYFSSPDSNFDGKSIYLSRLELGKLLARLYPVDADLVMGNPRSGNAAAAGYAWESGIPLVEGVVKRRFPADERSFITHDPARREDIITTKNVIWSLVDGKKVAFVDDSSVRGTTLGIDVKRLKNGGNNGRGVREVHVRISDPPIVHECDLGTDFRTKGELIARRLVDEYGRYDIGMLNREMARITGADSWGYMTLEGLYQVLGEEICTRCLRL
jgi:amidophosphoribosyltransferase